jgi:peptidoglycan/xylan/chitin deacetylase (PgdA/CDA1 family)
MSVPVFDCFSRALSLSVLLLAPNFLFPAPARAGEVADGMALIRQSMPANYCALTFDDGPGPYTAELLDLLAARGIVATFFVLGQQAERRPALIKRMLAEGHEVANHSYSHANLRRLGAEAQYLELKKTCDILGRLGAEPRWFRPPYGCYNAETVAAADALGMTIMLWSLDSQDWKNHVSRLEGLRSISPPLQRSFPGLRGVFLFHDTHRHTVGEMPDILDELVQGGCERFVSIAEYMAEAPVEEERRLSTHAPNRGLGETPPAHLPEASAPEQAAEEPLQAYAPSAPPGNLSIGALPPLARSDGTPVPLLPCPIDGTFPGAVPPLISRPDIILPVHKPERGTSGGERRGDGPG